MPKGKHTGPRLKARDTRAFNKVVAGKRQVDIAKEEGVSQSTISKRVAKAEAIFGPEWVQAQRDKLTELADMAIGGVRRHLKRPLPAPQVIGDFMKGTTIYRNEIEGNLALTALTDAELADRSQRLLERIAKRKT